MVPKVGRVNNVSAFTGVEAAGNVDLASTAFSLALRAREDGDVAAVWLSSGLDAGAMVKPINARIESAVSKELTLEKPTTSPVFNCANYFGAAAS